MGNKLIETLETLRAEADAQIKLIDDVLNSVRVCSKTGEIMNAGWYFETTDKYFKYEQDALEHAKELNYSSIIEAYEDDVCYYTEWFN